MWGAVARLPRVVIVDVAHPVTQRGNGRQFILASDSERLVYLDLLAEAAGSCALEEGRLWQALRYAQLNPVVAGLVGEAAAWEWSSAGAHCGRAEAQPFLEMILWRQHWSADSGRKFLGEGESEAELLVIRRCTHTGRPLGTAEFVRRLEERTQRRLAPQKGGRPRRPTGHPTRMQEPLSVGLSAAWKTACLAHKRAAVRGKGWAKNGRRHAHRRTNQLRCSRRYRKN